MPGGHTAGVPRNPGHSLTPLRQDDHGRPAQETRTVGSQADSPPEQSVQPATWLLLWEQQERYAKMYNEAVGPGGTAALEQMQLNKVLRARDYETRSLRKLLGTKEQELAQELAKMRQQAQVDIANKDEDLAWMQQEKASILREQELGRHHHYH